MMRLHNTSAFWSVCCYSAGIFTTNVSQAYILVDKKESYVTVLPLGLRTTLNVVGSFACPQHLEIYDVGSANSWELRPCYTGQTVGDKQKITPWSPKLETGREANNLTSLTQHLSKNLMMIPDERRMGICRKEGQGFQRRSKYINVHSS
jgi:hypothetical protein